MRIRRNIPLKRLTTLKLGGPALFFVEVHDIDELREALAFARTKNLPFYVMGEGSNLVPADRGLRGLLIRIVFMGLTITGSKVNVASGENLLSLIHRLNKRGLAGMERMAGIPGTIAGAIYGNAGAYGQETKNHLREVTFFDGRRIRVLKNAGTHLEYRNSIFKRHKNWIILSASFRFSRGNPRVLAKTSREIIALREIKYKPGLRCPGSFFKNIKLDDLSVSARKSLLKNIPVEWVTYGKVAAGRLLEGVGAKGMREGGIRIAVHHGNLFYNAGRGTTAEIQRLAKRLKGKVKKRFGVELEEEVQYLT
jgi:UDP-N-acetylenolpyruvoylglucosamine reductase